MVSKYPMYIENFECAYELIIDLTKSVNYVDKANWPFRRTLQFLLLKNSLYPLYSSFDRLLKGFYDDSVILLRTTYEAFIRILYLSYFQEEVNTILADKLKKGQRKFNLTNFLRDDLKVDWGFIFSISSSFSHSYQYQTLEEAIDISQNDQTELICFKLEFNEDKASIPMNFQVFLLWGMIKFSKLLFYVCQQHGFNEKYQKKISATEEAIGLFIKTIKNKWSITYNDIERIYNEVLEKEMK
jgi:hypothetical protein